MSEDKKVMGLVVGLIILLIVMISVKSGKINIGGNSSNVAYNSSQDATDGNSGKNSDEDNGNDNNSNGSGDNSDSNNNSNGGSGSNGRTNSNGGSSSNGSKDGSITNFENTGDKVSSNYKASDADITIQKVQAYSGIYIEDGSDKDVSNIAAIQVKNNSNQAIEFAQIQLYNGNKKLVFDVSALPPNASAVVMEKNKAGFSSSKGVTYGGTTVGYTSKLEKASTVKCEKADNNGIKVTNTSKKDIPCVRIFYKYKSSDGYYVGGITYTAKVEDLKAGESQTVYPSHFDSDGGEIMMVKTYTTKD
ncbi:hypothetical protein [Intestinibacter sp.]